MPFSVFFGTFAATRSASRAASTLSLRRRNELLLWTEISFLLYRAHDTPWVRVYRHLKSKDTTKQALSVFGRKYVKQLFTAIRSSLKIKFILSILLFYFFVYFILIYLIHFKSPKFTLSTSRCFLTTRRLVFFIFCFF